MHANSLSIMQKFIAHYLSPDKRLNILDLGSRVVPDQSELGSYRQLCANKKWRYTGADIAEGENVDIIITNGYKFPFNDEEFDVVISGQTIEHVDYPWVWFIEMKRVLKQGGICCIIAPAVIEEHRYPIDTFRYYPDGMRALARWSELEILEVERIAFTEDGIKEEDTYLIAKKA